MKKKKEEEKDPREGCKNCASLYSLEKPGMHAIRNSRNFIALTKDDPEHPSVIMIIPKMHKDKSAEFQRDEALRDESQNLIAEVLGYCDKKRKFPWKCFSVIWKNATHAINYTQSFAHLKTHAHAEIHITY